MNSNGILKQLSSIECDLFYAIDEGNTNGIHPDIIKAFHEKVADLLEEWHEITGETL